MGKGAKFAWIVTLLVATVAVTAATVELAKRGQRAPASAETPAERTGNPNEVRFPDGAPELGFIRVEQASLAPEPLAAPFSGKVAYDESRTARIASPIAGRVMALHAQAGDYVARGAPLLTLDAPEYAQAIADARKAESDLRLKSQALRRASELFAGEVLARKDLESAEADFAAATAEAARAKSRFSNLTAFGGGDRFVVRAPIAGRIIDRQANPGMEVRPDAQSPLFVISDITQVWVLFELSELELGKVHVGDRLQVRADAYPDRVFPATLAWIGDALDPQTRRVVARVTVANAERLLKPEMFAKVAPLGADKTQAIRLPPAAFLTEGLYTSVFVEIAPRTYARRRVTPGLQTADAIYVRDGLAAGDRVVVQGALLLNSELASAQ